MRIRMIVVTVVLVVVPCTAALALNTDDELWIPAAARGGGVGDSVWITDLYVMNLGDDGVNVEFTWLVRDADNSDADSELFQIAAGETLVLDDVILNTFGMEAAAGAIHIEVDEGGGGRAKEDGDEDDFVLVANARIYNQGDEDETFGQGFEGLISDAAIEADEDEGEPTHVVGVTDNTAFRSNWYGLNITEDEEDVPVEAEVLVELLDLDGTVLASAEYTMPPLAPMLKPLSDLGGPDVANATVRFTMLEGRGLFGVSKVDELTNDPTTLEAHWECEDEDEPEFTEEFFIEDCSFATTGENSFFILEEGVQLVLEGEEDGEEISAVMTVLSETEVVDGVETRVVEERETVDGELAEISRNFWAFCTETASIFYFGEDVDIYEDGQVVSHEGAWRAGVDGAVPGIIMPGTALVGSRYFQEMAPDVAMDRAEHTAMGVTVETEAGTFEDCLEVVDSSPLDPGSEDTKIYCPGVGLVVDEELELVEFTLP
jgi:hypothetical protein